MTMHTSVYVKYEPKKAKWRVYMLRKKIRISALSDITFFRDLQDYLLTLDTM